jgi:hypothetical protein
LQHRSVATATSTTKSPALRSALYAVELQDRKRAAEFVAKQIRMAQAKGRDVTAMLTALAEAPAPLATKSITILSISTFDSFVHTSGPTHFDPSR